MLEGDLNKPFPPQREAGIWGGTPPWSHGAVLVVGFWWGCLSLYYPIPCRYLLSHVMGGSEPASLWIAFRGNWSLCSCRVAVGRRNFRSGLCRHLGPGTEFDFLPWWKVLHSSMESTEVMLLLFVIIIIFNYLNNNYLLNISFVLGTMPGIWYIFTHLILTPIWDTYY